MTHNDDFDGIFDHLNPEDFSSTTTAVHEQPAQEQLPPFDAFVSRQLTAVRYAFAAADGAINSVATLANGRLERMFAPQDDETLGQYIDRLAREARLMDARWLFISAKTDVGSILQSDAEDPVAADDTDAIAVAENMGTVKEAVFWYAERVDEPLTRTGFLTIVGLHLGDLFESELAQPVRSYGRILKPASD